MTIPTARDLSDALNGKKAKQGYKACCPAHDDTNPSLSIGTKDGKTVFKCFAGCSQEAVLKALRDKGLWPEEAAEPAGLTLQQYALDKELDVQFLRDLGLSDKTYYKRPAVRIPYYATDGTEKAVRFRLALQKSAGADNRFRWTKGSKVLPYGLNRLPLASKAGYIVLVEGESDCHTLWQANVPALGIPGANTWKNKWAEFLDGIEDVYIVIEPDHGGESLRKHIATSPIRDRAFLLDLGPYKDPSSFYKADVATFGERWKSAMDTAVAWTELQEQARTEEATAAYEEAKALLHDPALMDRVGEAIRASDYAGELRTAKTVYLALTSRLMERPLNLHIKAPSAAGKSYNVKSACKLVPPEAIFELDAGSERALIYSDEDYQHKVIIVSERDSIPEEGPAASAIRTVADENQMSYHVVQRHEETGEFYTRHIVKQGPTGIITTGLVSLGEQMGTRVLELEVPDNPDQTKAVLALQARRAFLGKPGGVDLAPFLALQRWLEGAGIRDVTIPYAEALVDALPDQAFKQVRLRRDFTKLLSCIKTLAMLHQKQRRIVDGKVEADIADYAVARDLLEPVFTSIASEGVTPAIRETVKAVADLLEEKPGAPVTRAAMAEKLGLSNTAVYHRIRNALKGGWLADGRSESERKTRAPMLLTIGAPLPDETPTLPPVSMVSTRCLSPIDTQKTPPTREKNTETPVGVYVSSHSREKHTPHNISQNGVNKKRGGISHPETDRHIDTYPDLVEEIGVYSEKTPIDTPFTPSAEWQEIPDGTPVPPGGEYRMDMNSGKNYGRWPEQTPANGNGLGRVFTDAEIGRVAEPPDEQGRRVVKDSHGLWFDEDGRLWDRDEEPLQGTLRWLKLQLEALV